ncbi:hypothetical protein HDU97_003711 [Phlyctochytrium planicorne]|nr:hypothetical protein HDU97_003711 [Phlyctochytrium planicorne]
MYMVQREKKDEMREVFSVLGSTGNLFVKLKVLRIDQTNELVWAKKHLDHELLSIFSNAAADPTVVASKRVQQAFAKATGKSVEAEDDNESCNKRKPQQGDSCPICYDDFVVGDESGANALVYCVGSCGNPLHAECFKEWNKNCGKKGQETTCVYCRSVWVDEKAAEGAGGRGEQEGYLNLGSVAGVTTRRDTSTYHRWGSWGRKRRYDYYDDDY